MSDFVLRQLQVDELNLLPQLMQDCFGMQVDEDYFKWKYLNNPAGNFIGYGAFHGNRLVGFKGVFPGLYDVNGIQTIIYQSGDAMTHPDFRRQGLFEKLATCCFNKIQEKHPLIVIGFGGTKSTPGLIKIGWRHLADVRYFFIHKLQLKWKNLFSNRLKDYHIYETSDLNDIVALYNKYRAKRDITPIYNNSFLTWRLANPRFVYRCVLCKKSNENVGFLIYYQDGDKLFILDYCGQTDKTLKALFRYAGKVCIEKNLKGLITIAIPESSEGQQLKRCGFLQNPLNTGPMSAKIPFIVLTEPKLKDRFLHQNQWLVIPICHDAL